MLTGFDFAKLILKK